MKRIALTIGEEDVVFEAVDPHAPIFAKKNGKFIGFVVKESNGHWIVRTGGSSGATGSHHTLRDCLDSCLQYGYEFFVN